MSKVNEIKLVFKRLKEVENDLEKLDKLDRDAIIIWALDQHETQYYAFVEFMDDPIECLELVLNETPKELRKEIIEGFRKVLDSYEYEMEYVPTDNELLVLQIPGKLPKLLIKVKHNGNPLSIHLRSLRSRGISLGRI